MGNTETDLVYPTGKNVLQPLFGKEVFSECCIARIDFFLTIFYKTACQSIAGYIICDLNVTIVGVGRSKNRFQYIYKGKQQHRRQQNELSVYDKDNSLK
ncbi:unnamed protein product [Brassica oleracea]